MTEYRVRNALRGADLSALLKYLGGFTTTLGVVVAADLWNEDARWQPSMRQAIESMEPHLIARERTHSWPGTTSYGEHVRSLYGVGDDLLDTFASRSARLADWAPAPPASRPALPAGRRFRCDGIGLLRRRHLAQSPPSRDHRDPGPPTQVPDGSPGIARSCRPRRKLRGRCARARPSRHGRISTILRRPP